jgi:hypothetical protein
MHVRWALPRSQVSFAAISIGPFFLPGRARDEDDDEDENEREGRP